jgi:hypothetical protein
MNMSTIGIAVIVVALVAAFTGIVSAVPDGATGTANAPVTKATVTATSDDAQGGYIAEFNLTVMQQTTKWQGYYGNMTAGITLDDDTAATMYSWTTATPAGEVYATTLNGVPAWTTFTNDTVSATVDTAYGFVSGESDDMGNTFLDQDHAAFYLAGTEITAGMGQRAVTTGTWETVILLGSGAGTATNDYLFVGIIRDNTTSYKGAPDTCDYQMIIPENPSTGTTPYYFYAEIT